MKFNIDTKERAFEAIGKGKMYGARWLHQPKGKGFEIFIKTSCYEYIFDKIRMSRFHFDKIVTFKNLRAEVYPVIAEESEEIKKEVRKEIADIQKKGVSENRNSFIDNAGALFVYSEIGINNPSLYGELLESVSEPYAFAEHKYTKFYNDFKKEFTIWQKEK